MHTQQVSWYQKKHSPSHTHEEDEEGHAQTARSTARLLDPTKLAYNQSRPTMDQYAGSPDHSTYCYAELATSFINFLHYCLPSSGFYGAGKDNRGRCTKTDNLSGCHLIWTVSFPTSVIPHFYAECAFCHNPPNWYRIMLACIV